ncbi:zinc finger protein BRUTUS-like [Scenedesmus sp. PABB004]|nr:zinc finger protein BRUTUS-like [Scenedesmus sp. PABB004]
MAAALAPRLPAEALGGAGGAGGAAAADVGDGSPSSAHPPINFLYGHLHESIRTELDNLSRWALELEAGSEAELLQRLAHLKERYRFLEQVYKYHSSVEDEVVYPALDTKVKNVTSAYSVEHQDEEYLFEHLASLLTSALTQEGAERTATIRQLICKVEEIHITLRKHLAKEEAQLLPLLLQHFSHAEQAELVAQFLYCIPLDTVERVLGWLKPMVPLPELVKLMDHLRDVIPDRLLLALLVTWLSPSAPGPGAGAPAAHAAAAPGAAAAAGAAAAGGGGGASSLVICPFAASAGQQALAAAAAAAADDGGGTDGSGGAAADTPGGAPAMEAWPPLRCIVLFHHSIRGALEVFAAEAAALQAQAGVTPGQLAGLVERHRFLRSVCMFHTASEEEVMFPAVLRVSGLAPSALSALLATCSACQAEHGSELALFEELGRLLADVRAFVRRGRTRDVSGLLAKLVSTARDVCDAIGGHMQREERQVLPLLAARLGPDAQRGMVWHTLRAMPLRLLERVLPWLLSKLSDEDAEGMLSNLRLGAPQVDQQLLELLLRWAQRGRWPLPDAAVPGGAAGAAAAPALPDAAAGRLGAEGAPDTHAHLAGVVPAAVIEALCRSCGSVASLEAAAAAGAAPRGGDDVDAADAAAAAAVVRNMHDPCYFANDTCELRLIRQASDGGSGSPRKRQRLGDAPESSSADATPTAAAAAAAAAAAGAGAAEGAAAALASAGSLPRGEPEQEQQQQLEGAQAPGGAPQQRDAAAAAGGGAAGGGGAAAAPAGAGAQPAAPAAPAAGDEGVPGHSPIDHIFQFHKALRRELRQLEAEAAALEHAVLSSCEALEAAEAREQQQAQPGEAAQQQQEQAAGGPQPAAEPQQQQQQQQAPAADTPQGQPPEPPQQQPPASSSGGAVGAAGSGAALLRGVSLSLQQLDGRFQFLWGIYRAHSKAEDEIVFPALESKEALHNVSHAYTLDHEQEEQLFVDLERVIGRLKASGSAGEARELALTLRRMCAAVRASLETHVRAEEAELWPLFSEHFTPAEQQHLVGVIIGRTGAEVLQALLPWVTGSFSEEEKEAMMGSLREATKNTMFDQWLDAVQAPGGAGAGAGAATTPRAEGLAAVAQYLSAPGAGDAGGGAGGAARGPGAAASASAAAAALATQTEVSGTVAESAAYTPGWEEIFNINQAQLEAAIRRVSSDASLEPDRKAYLIQNIMVSRYIVAQQRRMNRAAGGGGGAAASGGGGGARGAEAPAAGGSGGGAAAAAGGAAAGGGCCHHHHGSDAGARAGAAAAGEQQQQQQEPAAPGGGAAVGEAHKTYADAAAGVLGCKHYRRSAQLVAPCCGKVFTCRLCHDEATGHRLDRYAVAEMVCMHCGARQPVGGSCGSCGSCLSRYYCGICHLFDDAPGRDIYHCPFCNVCRRGKGLGVDFFHCMQCNACMSLTLFESHTCRERAMEGNCPVCHEYLFDSATPIKELPCGHFLHSACFAQYARYAYTCPLCCKSIGNMGMYFQMIDSLLAAEAASLPPAYAGRTQAVLCQDCGAVGAAPYHYRQASRARGQAAVRRHHVCCAGGQAARRADHGRAPGGSRSGGRRGAGWGEAAPSPLPELPEPLVLHVLDLLPPALQAWAAKLVCKAARKRFRGATVVSLCCPGLPLAAVREAWRAVRGDDPWQQLQLARARAACGDVAGLAWLRGSGCDMDGVCEAAAEHGQVAVLERARDQGLDLCDVCHGAAWHGQLAVLRWARAQTPPVPWGKYVCYAAAERGDVEMLRWTRAQAEPAPWNKEVCRLAAEHGQVEALRWLRANGCPWDWTTCCAAAECGHLEALRWLRANGCPWSCFECELLALGRGHEAMLAWIQAQPDCEALRALLPTYCNWASGLPRELLLAALDGWAPGGSGGGSGALAAAGDEELLAAFLAALAATVPLEWTVTQHAAFPRAQTVAGLAALAAPRGPLAPRQQQQSADQARAPQRQQQQQQRGGGAARGRKRQQPGDDAEAGGGGASGGGGAPSVRQATTHAQGVGTPGGLLAVGGVEAAQLRQLAVQSEVSWIRDEQPGMLAADYSRVYQASPAQLSRQVVAVSRAGARRWAAAPCSPALSLGLVGHSAVLHGARVFIFGGMEPAEAAPGAPGDAGRAPRGAPTAKLRAYAISEAGTQGGLLPVLSEAVPQLGDVPSPRMHHRAAVDPGGGVMYVLGGVRVRARDGARLPADDTPGTLHAYRFDTYTWTTLATTGACRPRSTTLLALWWHGGALWAIPDVLAGQPQPGGYRVLRLDMASHEWERVATAGEPPCLRIDACAVALRGRLLVYGGRTAALPSSLLPDLHVLHLDASPPTWEAAAVRRVGPAAGASAGAAPRGGGGGLLPLAGHAGGADEAGRVFFLGGYSRADVREPQGLLQVLERGVRPPTPDAALLSGAAAGPVALALQHVRLQVARLVRQHHPKQVLLRPDGGGGVRLPARLLALYSGLFDDLFQGLLTTDSDGDDHGDQTHGGPPPPPVVPVPGVGLEGIAAVCRWLMGLLALGSCPPALLVDMFRWARLGVAAAPPARPAPPPAAPAAVEQARRAGARRRRRRRSVADRLAMEGLMGEALEALARAEVTPEQADAVLRLAGDLSGGSGAPAPRARHGCKELQERCVEAMLAHRRSDVWAALDFGLRFALPRLQGSCLAHLREAAPGQLVNRADRVVEAARRHAPPGGVAASPAVQMLETDLCEELGEAAGLRHLPSYAAAAERLGLPRLRRAVVAACAGAWAALQRPEGAQVLAGLRQRCPDIMAAAAAAAGAAQPPPTAAAAAAAQPA